MDVYSLLRYPWERQIANLRAVLQEAEAAAEKGSERAAEVAETLRMNIAEAEDEPHPSSQEDAEERRRALDCKTVTHGTTIMDKERFLRLGLCLILDGHHKMRAAANLGFAVTVLCYGLQGVAITCFDVPGEGEGDAENLYFDSEAIFEAVAWEPEEPEAPEAGDQNEGGRA